MSIGSDGAKLLVALGIIAGLTFGLLLVAISILFRALL